MLNFWAFDSSKETLFSRRTVVYGNLSLADGFCDPDANLFHDPTIHEGE